MTPALAHVAIIVENLDDPRTVPLAPLRLRERSRDRVASERVSVSFVPAGGADLEFLCPDDPDGALSQFLAARGESIHHIAFRVPDMSAAIERARAAGLRFAGDAPRGGAHGTSVAFIHPSSLYGVLMEFVEMPS